jgi:protein-S-isoprenylcysteine O-methyltransferase Ste14
MTMPGEAPPATGPEDEKRLLPPMVFLAALVAMGALHQLAPGPELVPSPWNRIGWVPFVAAVALAFQIKFRFDKLGTPIRPFETSTVLVTDGPFAISRNPIYFGMVVGLLGIAVALGTATPLAVIPAFVWFIQRNFIAVEEKMLEDAFGDAYRAYKSRVRRWI